MLRSIVLGLPLAALLTAELPAQFFGPPDPGMIFGFMDRNRDGRLDADEIENSRGPIRDRLRDAGVDYSRGISRDDFVEKWERMSRDRYSSGRDGDRDRYRGYEDRNRDEDRRRDEDRNGDDDRDRNRQNSSSASRTPQPKPRVTIDLQETFREGDRDFDGQIGLYEWRQWKGRSQLAAFSVLDANGDGFVTPREIASLQPAAPAAGQPAVPASTVAATSVPAPTASPAAAAVAPPPVPPHSTAPAAAAPNPALAAIVIDENDSSVRRYRSSFKLLDTDNSGTITANEWERSTNIRGRMAQANVDLTRPMDPDTFVRHLLFLDRSAGGE